MKNSFDKFLKSFVISFSIPFLGLILINFYVDPYGIFNKDLWPIVIEPSQYYHKVEHLKKNKNKYNSYLMGASTVGFTKPELLENYLSGSRFYNLWLSTVSQTSVLDMLKYLKREEFEIKNIYLQLDMHLMLSLMTHGEKDYQRKLHYDVKLENPLLYYFEYLTVFPKDLLVYKFKSNLFGGHKGPSYDLENGMIIEADRERKMAEDLQKYINSISEFFINKPTRSSRGNVPLEFNLEKIREIKKLCDENNINLIVLITPEHKNTVDTVKVADYKYFLSGLAKITEYWNFGGYNSVTVENSNYYEPGHYLPKVSNLIAGRIFHDKTVDVPDDFGIYINSKNIESHLIDLEKQFQARDQYIKN